MVIISLLLQNLNEMQAVVFAWHTASEVWAPMETPVHFSGQGVEKNVWSETLGKRHKSQINRYQLISPNLSAISFTSAIFCPLPSSSVSFLLPISQLLAKPHWGERCISPEVRTGRPHEHAFHTLAFSSSWACLVVIRPSTTFYQLNRSQGLKATEIIT